jgi:hypothetical protein
VRLTNRTHWRTGHLKAIIARVAQFELDQQARKRMRVEVTYNRQGKKGDGCSGWAPLGGTMIRVMVPSGTIDRVDLAHVAAHEFAHSRGMKHNQMRNAPRYRRVGIWRELYGWAAELPMERKPAPAPVNLDQRRERRLQRAQSMLEKWERKARVAARRVKRWRGRVRNAQRYIELAAVKPPKGAGA